MLRQPAAGHHQPRAGSRHQPRAAWHRCHRSPDGCYRCHEPGHFARDCPAPAPRSRAPANKKECCEGTAIPEPPPSPRTMDAASVLKRWKLNWCDLWIDGSLCFYKTDSRRDLEHRIGLKVSCIDVRSGLECGGVTPPETNPRENLIMVHLRDGSTLNLCANSEDESIAWKLMLLDTRRNPMFTYDPYDDSYQAVPLNNYHTVYITPGAGPGTHQVVVQRDPFDGMLENIALGILTGMAAGAAMRSFLWMPFFFC